MLYFIFLLCFACCSLIAVRSGFIRKTGLNKPLIFGLFSVHVLAGIAMGLITRDTISDYWFLNSEGWKEHQLLLTSPKEFFSSLFKSNYETYGTYFGSTGSYWNDLPLNIMVKILGILNFVSRGNYYINSIFFNLLGLFGAAALYRTFLHIYPTKKIAAITGCFLLPSAVAFTSSVHKDVVVFTAFAFFCYGLYFSFKNNFSVKRPVLIIASFVSILLLRSYVALAIVPATICWFVAEKFKWKTYVVFLTVYTAGIALLFISSFVAPSFQPVKIISDKQAAFFTLPVARSQIAVDTLQPTPQSLIQNAPQAITNTIAHPYFGEFPALPFHNVFAGEMFIYVLLFIILLFYHENYRREPFVTFSIITVFCIFLLIGYTVTNTGSIIRYRGIFLPWIITPMMCSMRWLR